MTTTPVLGVPELAQSQANPDVTHNEALHLLQVALRGAITQQGVPPILPSDGDVYIVDAAPSGAWSGRANCLAVRVGGAWRFIPGNDNAGTPIAIGAAHEGLRIWRQDLDELWVWSGSAWAALTGGGAVDSVNGQTGTVVLDAADILYDKTASPLDTVRNFIDSIVSSLGALAAGNTASDVPSAPVDKVTATDVQAAISQLSAANRRYITSNTTVYVRKTGNDGTGDGTTGNPWLTIQHAINEIATWDLRSFTLTIAIGNGTYAENLVAAPVSTGAVVLASESSTATDVEILPASGIAFMSNGPNRNYTLQNLSIGGASAATLNLQTFSNTTLSGVVFVGTPTILIDITQNARCNMTADCTVTVGGTAFIRQQLGALFVKGTSAVLTLTGTPAFSTAFALLSGCSVASFNGVNTVTGAATGSRFNVSLNSVLIYSSGTANLPGDASGTTATGGQA